MLINELMRIVLLFTIDDIKSIQDCIINFLDQNEYNDESFNKIKDLTIGENHQKLKLLLHFIIYLF